MNYRHAFHAGGFGDVLKHLVLVQVLAHLARKDKPFFSLDAFAGAGIYDLAGEEAQKTGEWRDGIGRIASVADPPAAVADYRAALAPHAGTLPGLYPGSPALIRDALRDGDRLVAVEAHEPTRARLAARLGRDARVTIDGRDGFAAARALLPPHERRGLVLLDPAFEKPDETRRTLRAAADALKRWQTGIVLVWYPIKDRSVADAIGDGLAALGRPLLVAELSPFPQDWPYRLNGCGMAVVNPPWRLDEALAEALPWLSDRLARADGAGWRLDRPAVEAGAPPLARSG